MSEADTKAGVRWIVDLMNRESQGLCWRDSDPRGVGTIPKACTGEEDAGLCYPGCREGYTGVGPVCWETDCKPNYHNDGALCGRRPHSYSASSTTADCPEGYTNNGATCGRGTDDYGNPSKTADCPATYTNNGATCGRGSDDYGNGSRTADCPSGYTNMGATCQGKTYGKKCSVPPFTKTDCRPGYRDMGCHCQKEPWTLGMGSMVCPSGWEKKGARCYKPCRAGYTNMGETCHRPVSTLGMGSMTCPSGWEKKGARCYRPCREGYTNTGETCHRVVSTLGMGSMTCPPDRFKTGARCYQHCREGYTQTGESCHRPAHSYARKSYGRGVGKTLDCASGEDKDAGLCYPKCDAGFYGVGPVCWGECPGSRPVNCGAACATSSAECAEKTVDMVIAPLEMVANIAGLIFTGGTANAAKQAAKAGTKAAVKAAARKSIKRLAREAVKKLARKLSRKMKKNLVERGLAVRKALTRQGFKEHVRDSLTDMVRDKAISEATKTTILTAQAAIEAGQAAAAGSEDALADVITAYLLQRGAETIVAASMANDETSLIDVLKELAVLDPTGTAEVVAAYAHGKCDSDPPLPDFTSVR